MAELDFTALNKLSYKGFETAEAQAEKDALIDQGFTIIEDKDNPFLQAPETASAPQTAAIETATKETSATPDTALKGHPEASEKASGTRNYKAMYRAAHDYHMRHNPPVVDREYWRTHKAGVDEPPQAEEAYWSEAVIDMDSTLRAHNGDPFLKGLLFAIHDEIEREYKALRDIAEV